MSWTYEFAPVVIDGTQPFKPITWLIDPDGFGGSGRQQQLSGNLDVAVGVYQGASVSGAHERDGICG